MGGKPYLLGFLIMVSIYNFLKRSALGARGRAFEQTFRFSLRVQVPKNHILSKIVTYITTIPNPST